MLFHSGEEIDNRNRNVFDRFTCLYTKFYFPEDSGSQTTRYNFIAHGLVFFSFRFVLRFSWDVFPEFPWLHCCLLSQILWFFCHFSPDVYASEQSIQATCTRFITCCRVHYNTPRSSGSFHIVLTVACPLAPCWSGALLEFWLQIKSLGWWIISIITRNDSGGSFFLWYTGQLWSNGSIAFGEQSCILSWTMFTLSVHSAKVNSL